jgi:hypothetical protein
VAVSAFPRSSTHREDPPVPDQSVEVTFDPNANPQFTFVPDTVTMTKAGKVVLHRRPQDAPWTFQGAWVDDNTQGQFEAEVIGNGNLLHIRDAFIDSRKRYHKYTITVRFEWGNHYRDYESPDPVIVNDPGSKDVDIAVVQSPSTAKGKKNK